MKHTISEHFQDNLIASTHLDPAVIAALDSAAVGPIKLSPTLSQIADSISVNTKDSSDASYARPSVLAHLSAFTQNCAAALTAIGADAGSGSHSQYISLPANIKNSFREWEGMVASIALSSVYSVSGLDLSLIPLKLNPNDPLHHAVLKEMIKDDYLRSAVTLDSNGNPVGTLFFICNKGAAFAVFHPEYGVFPMTTYNGSIFDGCIPWYNGEWTDVVDWSSGTVSLDDFCMNRILWWCRNFGMNAYANALDAVMRAGGKTVTAPNPALILSDCFGAEAAMNGIWPRKGTAFGAVPAAYMDNGRAAKIPDIFLDKLLIQYTAGEANNRTKYVDISKTNQTVSFANSPDFLSDYAPVLPFNENLLPLLDSIVDIRFTANTITDQLESVRVRITFRNSFGEDFSCVKDYNASQLRQTVLPYMMMWPYLDMPADTSWTSYYATWANTVRALPIMNLKDTSGSPISAVSFNGFSFDSSVSLHKLNRYTDEDASGKWSLCQSAAPFRYAFLCGENADHTGLLIFPRCPVGTPFTPPTSPVILGVDFGTTSTVCALKDGALTTPLPFKDYSICVTCMDDSSKKTVDQQRWLGETPTYGQAHNEKIFSIVQLFARNGRPDINSAALALDQEYYLDGRMFLPGSFLIDFVALDGVDDALSIQKITNDMKFSTNVDPENTHAASIFLAAIYTYAVLYLLEQRKIPNLTVRASYPNDVTRSSLIFNWTNAHKILDKMMDPAFTAGLNSILYCREATAAAEYYKKKLAMAAYANVLLSLDIGGGTTDMSISSLKNSTPRALSVRYAGRELMVDSLIEYYRRWYGVKGGEYSAQAFRTLWNYQDPNQKNFIDNFTALPAGIITADILQKRPDNRTVRIDTEYLLSKGLNMGVVASNPVTSFIRELIALKFLVIVKLASRFIGNHLDMWGIDARNDEGILNKLDFELQVSGTSAQLLQYIFDSADLVKLSTIDSAVTDHSTPLLNIFRRVLANALSEKLPFDSDRIMEKLNIRLYVDADVAKKQEVCLGLLEWDPTSTAPTAASAGTASMDDAERKQREQEVRNLFLDMESDSFKDFICNEQVGLLPLMKAYEDAYTSALNMDVGLKDIHHVSDLLKKLKYSTQFNFCRNVAAAKWSRYLVEDEQDDYRTLLMYAYVLNEYLNNDLASIQAQE